MKKSIFVAALALAALNASAMAPAIAGNYALQCDLVTTPLATSRDGKMTKSHDVAGQAIIEFVGNDRAVFKWVSDPYATAVTFIVSVTDSSYIFHSTNGDRRTLKFEQSIDRQTGEFASFDQQLVGESIWTNVTKGACRPTSIAPRM